MYLRISQEKKGEDVETLENHRQLMTDWITKNKLTYVEFGEVISGGKTEMEDRPKLKLLLDNIEQFDAILVVELSRISRNGLISQTVKQYCIDYDKPILTPYDQVYDLANSDNDRLMFDVGSMISSHEHGVIGKRSKANKIQMAKAGLHVSGAIPFGYVRNPKTKKLEIDKETAPIVKYIFELHSQGLGSFKIRDILNEEGFKPARANVFNLPSIKRIIRNPHYKGWTVFNDRKKIKKGGKFVYDVVDTIVIENTHPAIISPQEWDKANKDRVSRANKHNLVREKPAVKSGITSLKDLLFCGVCGRKMTIRKDYKSSTGYIVKRCEYLLDNGDKCPNSGIRLEPIENRLQLYLDEYSMSLQSEIDELSNEGNKALLEINKNKIGQLQKRLKETIDQEGKLIDLALSGIFTTDEIKVKKQELINTKNTIENSITLLEKEIDDSQVEEEINKYLSVIDVIQNNKTLSPEGKNEGYKTFIDKIYYTRVIPEHLRNVSTRNPERQNVPFTLKIVPY